MNYTYFCHTFYLPVNSKPLDGYTGTSQGSNQYRNYEYYWHSVFLLSTVQTREEVVTKRRFQAHISPGHCEVHTHDHCHRPHALANLIALRTNVPFLCLLVGGFLLNCKNTGAKNASRSSSDGDFIETTSSSCSNKLASSTGRSSYRQSAVAATQKQCPSVL